MVGLLCPRVRVQDTSTNNPALDFMRYRRCVTIYRVKRRECLAAARPLPRPKRKLGFCPRFGIDFLDRFSFAVDYNFIPSSKLIELGNEARVANSYLGLHLGALCFIKKQN